MKVKRYNVAGLTGGYAGTFDWLEAEELAREESKDSIRFIMDEDDNTVVALFYDGERYIKATGRICERCNSAIREDDAHYAYELTGHFFCSAKCGVELGVLTKGNEA